MKLPCVIVLSAILMVPARAVDFGREVRPIFKEHCFECHGQKKQKSGLRLDLRAAAMRGGDEGVVIVPGKSGESSLVAHVSAARDDEMAMPPKGQGLSAGEVEIFRKWVDEGAVWPDASAGEDARLGHWAYQPLEKIENLEFRIENESAPGASFDNPIDFFVEKGLAKEGLAMSPEAGRRTLIRRLSFDLHGLPPEPEAVEAFVNDRDPKAYEELVDQMLASPHYGERYARHWLDIAHYADTHGFERDQRRDSAWRYRDYVIDSLNADKPYGRFLEEQIAGDVLWPSDEEAIVATGFLAAGPWDFTGQVETKSPVLKRLARALDLDDIVTQVMAATTASTVNCARCHDHKLDPISQEEYYALWSVFAGVKREERVISEEGLKRYEAEKAGLMAERDRVDFTVEKIEGRGLDLADIVGGGNGTGTGIFRHGISPRYGSVATRNFGKIENAETNRFRKVAYDFVDGVLIPDGEGGEAKIPVTSTGITVTGLPKTSAEGWDAIRNGSVASQHSNELGGVDFTAAGHSMLGLHANAGITFDLAAIREATGEGAMRFTARAGYFGKEGKTRADLWVFVDGEEAVAYREVGRADGLKEIDVALAEAARFLTLISTDGGNGIGNDQVGFGDPRLRPDVPREVSPGDRLRLTRLKEEKRALDAEIEGLGSPPKIYAIVEAGEKDRRFPEIRVMRRGDPESPVGEEVEPAALSALAMLDADLGERDSDPGERRVALARWITDPKNPLTPRVIVNRLWHWHFGQGIVKTPSDFGLGGGEPSHPELLDWMAAELGRRGGSLKAMHRLILTSAAYKQDSRYAADVAGVRVDAGNRMLWRQNPKRIEAEAVRDAVLAVSGKLNAKRGGPGFEDFTYREAYAPIYEYVTADEPKLWRRSIYRYIVRTTPDRFLTTMDCPDAANLAPVRFTTTTALQSLALYNNEFMLRQSGYFAERVEKDAGGRVSKQVVRAFALALGRGPSKEERRLGVEFVRKEGLFAFCRSMFNANEFVYVD